MHALLMILLLVAAACSEDKGVVSTAASLTMPERLTLPAQRHIETSVVTRGPAKRILTLTGKVAYGEDGYARVSTPLEGRIVEVLARVGDRVRAGDVLLVMDSAEIAQTYADFIREQAERRHAKVFYQLARDLYAVKALSLKDLKHAERDLVKAEAEFHRAKERLLALGVPSLEVETLVSDDKITARFELRSPLSGTVVARTAVPGQSVGRPPNEPLFTVADLGTLQVIADVYERDIAMLHTDKRPPSSPKPIQRSRSRPSSQAWAMSWTPPRGRSKFESRYRIMTVS